MEDLRTLFQGALRAERWAKIRDVLDRRLGAVRVVVENLHHPHNMSALVRTCEAFGIQWVHAVEAVEAFSFSRRVSLGAHKWLSLRRHDTFDECAEELRGKGFRLYAAVLEPDAVPVQELPVNEPLALVLGNEREGVSRRARALCDGAYTIPMAGFVQSLNISVAAAISVYSITTRVRALRPDRGLLSEGDKEELLRAWLPKSLRCGKRMIRALGSEGTKEQA